MGFYNSQIINHPMILKNGRDHEYETRVIRLYFDELMNVDSVSDTECVYCVVYLRFICYGV